MADKIPDERKEELTKVANWADTLTEEEWQFLWDKMERKKCGCGGDGNWCCFDPRE